jgi:hypothetical protein
MASSPILAIVPLSIRRLRGPSLTRVIDSCTPVQIVSSARRYGCRLERRPEEARQFAGDRHGDLRRRLMLGPQFAEAPTQSLLRLVRDSNYSARLPFAASRESDPHARSMLIVPRRFHQQPADQRVAGPGDAAPSMFLAGRVLTRHEADIRH